MRAWALEKGFDRLADHLEGFIGRAVAKGYTYVDWDAAFMNAVREDWAGLRANPGAGVTRMTDRAPAWATAAGFPNRFEAENEGCFEHNSQEFRGGRRVGGAR